jgi:hypothetical protein
VRRNLLQNPWSEITRETGLTKGTAQRAFYSLPKNHLRAVSTIR